MSFIPPVIPYASHAPRKCPLCTTQSLSKKTIYGHHVCAKCFNQFANRRQLGYLIDVFIFLIPTAAIAFMIVISLKQPADPDLKTVAIVCAIAFLMGCIFCLKDGFGGYSPGKWMTNLRVLSDAKHKPISFIQSFKRNSIFLVGNIPIVGSLIGAIVFFLIAKQVGGGYRLGDRFGKTRVIWKKYANLPLFGEQTTKRY
jgi:uncharacterized RDD family membrane protein YckC